MRLRACIILAVVFVIGTTGCGKGGAKENINTAAGSSTEVKQEENASFPAEVYKKINDKLEVNAAVNVPENFSGVLKCYNTVQHDFDEQLIFEVLNITVSEMENPAQGTFFNEEKNLSIGEMLGFTTKKGEEYQSLANPEFCKKEGTLSFASKEETMEQVLAILQSMLQTSSLEVYEAYIFDAGSEKMYAERMREDEGYRSDIKTGETNSENILNGNEGGYFFRFVETVD